MQNPKEVESSLKSPVKTKFKSIQTKSKADRIQICKFLKWQGVFVFSSPRPWPAVVAPDIYLLALAPNLCLPGLAPNLFLSALAPICVYHLGPQFVFAGPGPWFVFGGPGSRFVFTGSGRRLCYWGWVCVCRPCLLNMNLNLHLSFLAGRCQVLRHLVRQLLHTMCISNNRASIHLWWKENLVKHQKVSKYESDCRKNKLKRVRTQVAAK